MDVLTSVGVCFKGTDVNVYGGEKDKVAFFDSAKKKVFLSPNEKEYPGDQYEELKAQDKPETAEDGSDSSDKDKPAEKPEEESADKPKDKPKGGVE